MQRVLDRVDNRLLLPHHVTDQRRLVVVPCGRELCVSAHLELALELLQLRAQLVLLQLEPTLSCQWRRGRPPQLQQQTETHLALEVGARARRSVPPLLAALELCIGHRSLWGCPPSHWHYERSAE